MRAHRSIQLALLLPLLLELTIFFSFQPARTTSSADSQTVLVCAHAVSASAELQGTEEEFEEENGFHALAPQILTSNQRLSLFPRPPFSLSTRTAYSPLGWSMPLLS